MRPDGISSHIYPLDVSLYNQIAEIISATLPQTHGCFLNMNIVGKSFEIRNIRPNSYEAYCAQLLDGTNHEPLTAAADGCLAALQTIGDLRR